MENSLGFKEISPFMFRIASIENIGENVIVNDQHTHDVCEIYMNLSGDVSFMVENTVYPIERGSIIITRPFEAHHCIYHSKKEHDHIWILFSAKGNEELFDLFFAREKGVDNLIVLSPEKVEEFITVCKRLVEEKLSEFQKYNLFFTLLNLLHEGTQKNTVDTKIKKEILSALNIINKNISEVISISELSKMLNLSVRTFERQFKTEIGMTPMEYVKKRRLTLSKAYLAEDYTVSEASEMCGFSDCSSFIQSFKKEYGLTPYKFKSGLE
ncbi:MAG: AraC family transcriptional regulator [Clostridia bacterium]|nr:AraC family transcriptional regulator [Clostridia bacterium]